MGPCTIGYAIGTLVFGMFYLYHFFFKFSGIVVLWQIRQLLQNIYFRDGLSYITLGGLQSVF